MTLLLIPNSLRIFLFETVPARAGADMPLDPLAKRLLAMMAAASTGRPVAAEPPHERRQALVKLMQFARAGRAAGDSHRRRIARPGR